MQFIDLKRQYQEYQADINREISEVLNSCSFILGKKGVELEEKLKNFVGTQHAIGVSSGTDALLFCLMAKNIQPGDEIITSPFTFIATAEVIRLSGAKPVFVDIDPVTYNMNPDAISQAITKNTKGIIAVSLYGLCADLKRINEIAKANDLFVIEDACQSFGAENDTGKSCGLTEMGCTSFFPSKPFGCYGDGGMIFANDDLLAKKLMMIRVHGQAERYKHEIIGTNGRMDSLQSAVLLAKWPYFEKEVASRIKAADYYIEKLQEIPDVILPETTHSYKHVYAQFSIQVNNRDKLQDFLQQKEIPTAVHYPIPLHLQPVFKDLNYSHGSFPVSESLCEKIISLPMHPFITREDQNEIVLQIKNFICKNQH